MAITSLKVSAMIAVVGQAGLEPAASAYVYAATLPLSYCPVYLVYAVHRKREVTQGLTYPYLDSLSYAQ